MSLNDFPQNFVWGTATAAYQVEGGIFDNDWWDWEQVPGHIRNGDSSRVACDWWGGRYAEDFDRAQSLGTNAHRLSVEWSRIEPREGEWDGNAIDYYRKVLGALHERGMMPFVTLLHFTQPRWFMAKGGWLADDSPRVFERFVTHAIEGPGRLGKQLDHHQRTQPVHDSELLVEGPPPGLRGASGKRSSSRGI